MTSIEAPIALHPCTEIDGATFFPPVKNLEDAALFLLKTSTCMDNIGELDIWGNFDSTDAQVIRVRIVRCKGRETCKTNEEILEFIDKNGHLLIGRNE